LDKVRVERRLAMFVLVLVLVFSSLGVRLAYLQVVKGEHYSELSQKNRIRIIPLPAPRGDIYDRYGQLMVANRPAFTVSLMEMDQARTEATVRELARILDMTEEEIWAKIEAHTRPFEPVRIKYDISPEVHTMIVENRDRLPGVMVEILPVRDYIYGPLAAHLFGYVREVSPEELDPEDEAWLGHSYQAGDIVGASGLERRYDRELRGSDGGQQVEVDAVGHPVAVLGEVAPAKGQSVVLTIDAELQKVAESFFDEWTARVREGRGLAEAFPEADSGAVVVMKVDTGEILAMFSRPAFDPNHVYRGMPEFNRILQGLYPPGSTFKMVTAAAMLEAGLTTGSLSVHDRGHYTYGDLIWRCWKAGGHGWVDVIDALKYSCNVYFYEMGARLNQAFQQGAVAGFESQREFFTEWANRFGLGVPTGIDLDVPEEEEGYIALTRPPWLPGYSLQSAIGQLHGVTPLQMAVYVSAIANGGTRYVPTVVKQVLSPEGEALREMKPEVAGTFELSPDTLDVIREGMLASATELTGDGGPGTSAWLFWNFPVPVAGKTGTATQTGRDDHAWYVSFAPYDDPEIAVVVIVEQGGHGSTAAAPIAKAIYEHYFGLREGAAPRPPSSIPSTGTGD